MRTRIFVGGVVLVAMCHGCASGPPAVPQVAGDPGMLVIGGGRFTMGRNDGELNERPAHLVDLDDFDMDRTEVSASEFAAFIDAVGNDGENYFTPDDHATVVIAQMDNAARDIRFKARPGYERYPANNVSWFGADAYCRWRGKRLPTEAEWEKAARGTDKRVFPWGKVPPRAEFAQFGQIWQEKSFNVLVPVDALPEGASPYGALNMAGNVLEWVNDWYRQNLCDFCNPEGEPNLGLIRQLTGQDVGTRDGSAPAKASPTDKSAEGTAAQSRQAPPRDNPTGPQTGSFKVLKGGSWLNRLNGDLAATRRFWLDPTQRFPGTGFRCVEASSGKQDSPPAPVAPAARDQP